MKKALIIGLDCKLGSKIITAEEIAERFGKTTAEIEKKSGITKLHLLNETENIIDMTVECAKRILHHKNVSLSQIDGIFGSSNPTMDTLIPSFTAQVTVKLGLKDVITDQIGLGCCGGLQALRNAHNQLLVDQKESYYLVVVADHTSRILDPNNFGTSILFSEGCSVLLLTNNTTLYDGFEISSIRTKSLLTDQQSLESIRLKNPYSNKGTLPTIEMNGAAIYKFGTSILEHILQCANTTVSDFQSRKWYLIPHQPNLRMLDALMNHYNLSHSQIYTDGIKTIGNTSGPAVFFGLQDALSRSLFSTNRWVILGAFGAELQVGGAMLIAYRNPRKIIIWNSIFVQEDLKCAMLKQIRWDLFTMDITRYIVKTQESLHYKL